MSMGFGGDRSEGKVCPDGPNVGQLRTAKVGGWSYLSTQC